MAWKACAIAFIINTWVLHVYAALCALIFRAFEHHYNQENNQGLQTDMYKGLFDVVSNRGDASLSNLNKRMIDQVTNVYHAQELDRFQQFRSAFLFSISSMATLGNSGLRLHSSLSKVFYVVSIAIGILLYSFAVYFGGKLIRYIFAGCISAVERKQTSKVSYLYLKMMILMDVFFLLLIQAGGVEALSRGKSYFDGVFIAVDVMGAIGAIQIADETSVVGYSLFLLLGLSSLCALIVISIKSSSELEALLTSACCSGWIPFKSRRGSTVKGTAKKRTTSN